MLIIQAKRSFTKDTGKIWNKAPKEIKEAKRINKRNKIMRNKIKYNEIGMIERRKERKID